MVKQKLTIKNLIICAKQFCEQESKTSNMFTDSKRAITKDLLMRIDFANHPIRKKSKQLNIFELFFIYIAN